MTLARRLQVYRCGCPKGGLQPIPKLQQRRLPTLLRLYGDEIECSVALPPQQLQQTLSFAVASTQATVPQQHKLAKSKLISNGGTVLSDGAELSLASHLP